MESLERKILEACAFRLLQVHEGRISVDMAGIEATVVEGLLCPTGDIDRHVAPSGWTSAEAIARGLTLEMNVRGARSTLVDWKSITERLPHLPTVVHEGMTFVRCPPHRGERWGDGHVTPNMEVMLGPAAHPEIVATVGLMAELQRLDTVLTYRITQRSVHDALAVGLTVERMVEALDRVGRHGIPANVRANVEDFARQAVQLEPLLVARVPRDAVPRVKAALGTTWFEEPAPGLLLVRMDSRKALESAIVAAGLGALELEPRREAPAARTMATPRAETTALAAPVSRSATEESPGRKGPSSSLVAVAWRLPCRARLAGTPATSPSSTSSPCTTLSTRSIRSCARGRRGSRAPRDRMRRRCSLPAWPRCVTWRSSPTPSSRRVSLRARRSPASLRWATERHPVHVYQERERTLAGLTKAQMETVAELMGDELFPLPEVGELPRVDRGTIADDLAAIAGSGEAVLVEIRSMKGPRVLELEVERLVARGNQMVILGTDLETDEALAIPVVDVLGYGRSADAAFDPFSEGSLLGAGATSAPFAAGAMKPGRNDPCPCGSGRKIQEVSRGVIHLGPLDKRPPPGRTAGHLQKSGERPQAGSRRHARPLLHLSSPHHGGDRRPGQFGIACIVQGLELSSAAELIAACIACLATAGTCPPLLAR